MNKITKIINIPIFSILLIFSFLYGCGIAPISVKYSPTDLRGHIMTGSPNVKLEVKDGREKKIFFRTALGENDDLGKTGMLSLIRPPRKIFIEGFTEALQTAGCQIFPDSSVHFDIVIKCFMAIDRENNSDTIKSDIVFDVSVNHRGRTLAHKTIFESDTRKQGLGQAWQFVVPPILNDSVSLAIEKAVWDPDIILAIERANGLNTTRSDVMARLKRYQNNFNGKSSNPLSASRTISRPQPTTNSSYQKPKNQTTRSGSSPFQASYVRGLGPPEVKIQNQSSKSISIELSGPEEVSITVSPRQSINKTLKSGTYSYSATASGVSPCLGTETFNTDYRYNWTFMIISSPSLPVF